MKQTLIFTVYIKPNAKTNEYIGWHGEHRKIAIKASPIEGKANKALITLLAEWFAVPKSQVMILQGETAKVKRIKVIDTTKELVEVFSAKD